MIDYVARFGLKFNPFQKITERFPLKMMNTMKYSSDLIILSKQKALKFLPVPLV